MIPSNIRIFLLTCFHVLLTVVVIAISTPPVLSTLVPLGILYYFIQVFVKYPQITIDLYHIVLFCSDVLCE